MQLTSQRLLPYQGLQDTQGVCHVRVYEQPGRLPVVIVGALDGGPGTSVTNAIEMIAGAIQAEFFADGREFQMVEHWPDTIDGRGIPTFALVHFRHRGIEEDPGDPSHYAGTSVVVEGESAVVHHGDPIRGDFRGPRWEPISDIAGLVGCEVRLWAAGSYTAWAVAGEAGQHLRDEAAQRSTRAIARLAAAIECG